VWVCFSLSSSLSYKRAAFDEPLSFIETSVSMSNYNIRGLTSGTMYEIKMVGFNQEGNSAFTKAVFQRTWGMQAPRQMPIPTEIEVGTNYADVAWPLFTDNLNGPDGMVNKITVMCVRVQENFFLRDCGCV
jgi:hypothetical protein